MRDEINRILKLVEDGLLTGDQASEMIDVLRRAQRGDAKPRDPRANRANREGAVAMGQAHRHRERRRHRHHRRGFGNFFEGIGVDVEHVVDEALRSVFGAAAGIRGDRWVNDTNSTMFAKVDEPAGSDYKVENNHLVVSQIGDLRLDNAEFCGNQMHASALREVAVAGGACNDNALRGSALKRATVEHSDLIGNQLNGAQITKLTVGHSSFRKNTLSGAQIRDLGLASSKFRSSTLSGVRLRSVMFKDGARLRRLELSGVAGSDWVVEASTWCDVRFKGANISGLVANRANLENCTFANRARTHRDASRGDFSFAFNFDAEAMTVRDLALEDVDLKDCKFSSCKFDGTAIRNVEAEGLRFKDVDFTGLTIASADELKALAGSADAA